VGISRAPSYTEHAGPKQAKAHAQEEHGAAKRQSDGAAVLATQVVFCLFTISPACDDQRLPRLGTLALILARRPEPTCADRDRGARARGMRHQA